MRKKLLVAAAVSLVSLPVAAYAGGLAPGPHASFTVRGANIQDPLGHRFIVRGAVIAPGSLTSPAGTIDAKALAGVRHDAQRLAAMGVNTVRLDVSAVANSDERLAAIRKAVAAARAAHLVVILSVHGGNSEQALTFVAISPGSSTRTAWSGCSPLSTRPATERPPTATAASRGRPGAPSSSRSCMRSAVRACTRRSCSRRRAGRATSAFWRTTT